MPLQGNGLAWNREKSGLRSRWLTAEGAAKKIISHLAQPSGKGRDSVPYLWLQGVGHRSLMVQVTPSLGGGGVGRGNVKVLIQLLHEPPQPSRRQWSGTPPHLWLLSTQPPTSSVLISSSQSLQAGCPPFAPSGLLPVWGDWHVSTPSTGSLVLSAIGDHCQEISEGRRKWGEGIHAPSLQVTMPAAKVW